MSFAAAERLARSLLFEGYVLYPYRASSLKNRQRWAFGSLYPVAFVESARAGDKASMRTECLLEGENPRIRVAVRFLQMAGIGAMNDAPDVAPFQQAIERSVEVPEVLATDVHGEERTLAVCFRRTSRRSGEPGEREAPETDTLDVSVTLSVVRLGAALWRLRVDVRNESVTAPEADRSTALLRTLVSTHTLLGCQEGRFVSLLEPEPALAAESARCENDGTWPILVGSPEARDTVLSSPIILYDFPIVAEESPGDLFDATEIDEVLSLRILTLTAEERLEVIATDPRARALLERTEALGEEELLRLHGAWRTGEPAAASGPALRSRGLGPGDSVVIRPRPGGDVMDLALAGEAATIVKVEEDMEGRLHYAVTVDCDPGRDLGEIGQPGHRFFFSESELERVP